MRRLLHLICLIVIIALLSGSLLLLQRPVVTPTTTAAPQESTYRMLYTRSQQGFAAMRVTLASGETYVVESSLAYDANGNLRGVYNNLGQPVVIRGQEDFALDSEAYQMMLLTAVNLPVTASYDGLDPQSCGPANPAAHIAISYHSAEPIVLTVGWETASGNSCYIQMAGDDNAIGTQAYHAAVEKLIARAEAVRPTSIKEQMAQAAKEAGKENAARPAPAKKKEARDDR